MSRLKKGSTAAKAWGRKMRALRHHSRSRASTPKTHHTKSRKTTMTRHKKGHHSRGSLTLPIAPIAGLIAGLASPAMELAAGRTQNGLERLVENYTGFRGTISGNTRFEFAMLKRGALPLAAGIAVHYLASRFGVNRVLGRARVPLIRI